MDSTYGIKMFPASPTAAKVYPDGNLTDGDNDTGHWGASLSAQKDKKICNVCKMKIPVLSDTCLYCP